MIHGSIHDRLILQITDNMEQEEKKQIIVPYDEYMELKRKADSHSVFITTTIKLDRDGICDLIIERADSECERQEDVDNWMKSLMGKFFSEQNQRIRYHQQRAEYYENKNCGLSRINSQLYDQISRLKDEVASLKVAPSVQPQEPETTSQPKWYSLLTYLGWVMALVTLILWIIK